MAPKDDNNLLLHNITSLLQDKQQPIPDLLQELTLMLPRGWQYPEITAARVFYDHLEFTTPNFSITPWKQSADFTIGDKYGIFEIFYLEEKPTRFEGPFLCKERYFITYLANTLRIYLEFRETLRALAKLEHEFNLIVNNIPAIVFKGYADWSVDLFDNKVEQITGYSRADFELRRRKWVDIVFDQDLDIVKKVFLEALRTSRAYVREYRIIKKDGQVLWIQERSHIILQPDGMIDYVSGIFFDVTERKRIEEELRKYREHLEGLVEKRTYELMSTNEQLQMEIAARERVMVERERLIRELQETMAQVKILRGLLPICASCKRIRDDEGYWRQMETYIRNHSEAEFTHGICPDCAKKLYPELKT